MDNELTEVLTKAPLFVGMEADKIEEFVKSCKIVEREKGYIFSQDELNRSLFIPIKGTVKSYQINPISSKAYIIFLFSAGQIFDIITFIDERQHEILFETIEDTKLLEVPHDVMNRWIAENSKINKNIIYLLSEMLQNLEQNASDLALYDTVTRLARLIFRNLPAKQPQQLLDSSKIKLKLLSLSNESIAQMIGSVREVVSRNIKTLKSEQVIEADDKKCRLINLKSLLKFIEK